MARDRIARYTAGREAAIAATLAYAVVFVTGFLGSMRWLSYAAFLYIPVLFAWLRGQDFAHYGLVLGNLRASLLSGLGSSAVLLGAFGLGYWVIANYTELPVPWAPEHSAGILAVLEFAVSQFLVVAIAEEYFYRGYLQSRLDTVWAPRWRILGAKLGPGWLVANLLFAVGHLSEGGDPARLLTFFPGLWFGWCRAYGGNVYPAVFAHAASNIVIAYLQGQFI